MSKKAPSFIISVRFLIAIIAFFGYAVQYIQRINMSVAIVCMVNSTAVKQITAHEDAHKTNMSFLQHVAFHNTTIKTSDEKCLFQQQKGAKSFDGPFVWNKKVQGLILSAYFYGYLTTQVLGGFMSLKFGAKIVLAGAILVGSILTLCIPVAARSGGYIALVICRFLIGVAHGSFWPAMSSLWAHWAPPAERGRLVGIANAGSQVGNVVALPLGGFLCVYGFDGGWASIFYIFGIIGIVWFVFWICLTSKSPSDHKFIKEEEREYILENTRDAVANQKNQNTPWVSIISSKSFYGLIIAHSSSNFGTYLLLTQLPTYMKEILKFDIKSNGGLSALPYIVFWFFIIVSSVIGDKLIESNILSKTAVRKVFNTLGAVLPMAAVIGLVFVTCAHPYVGVALLTLGLAFTGCGYGAGFMVNYNDIAGTYAGLVFGMANTIATIPGIIAPYLVGVLTTHQTQSEWRNVFIIMAVVYLLGAIGFIILGNGNTEPWAAKKSTPKSQEEEVPLYHQKA